MRKNTGSTQFQDLKISKLENFEDRAMRGTFGRKTVRFSQFEVQYGGMSYVIVKSQQQVEELSERLRLEVFHVSLPQLAVKSPRSPRGGGGGTTPAADEYLQAIAEKGASLSDSRTLKTFLTTNIAAKEKDPFWDTDVRKKGWLNKKKGDRAKLQKRFCVVKFGTLFYFRDEKDLNPAGSIRLDVADATFFKEGEMVGFSLQGGRQDKHPRTFVTETQGDCDRWMAEIRAAKAAHEKSLGSVHGALSVMVRQGRNLNAQNLYVQVVAEAQQFYTNVVLKSNGNPAWTTNPFNFEISSNRKFLYALVFDQPANASSSPTCIGEVSIPVSMFVSKSKRDFWVPLCPQSFFSPTAAGEIHLQIEYTFTADQKTLQEQQKTISLYFETIGLVIDYFMEHPEGLKSEGLFRIPGRMLNMQKMWDTVVSDGVSSSILEGETFEDVGGLLKMCLRNIPIPVFPFEVFDRVTHLNPEDKNFFQVISEIVNTSMSPEAQALLHKLLKFLNEVSKLEEFNKMSLPNLSVVFGPALIREEEDSLEMLTYLPKINKIVQKLIATPEKLT